MNLSPSLTGSPTGSQITKTVLLDEMNISSPNEIQKQLEERAPSYLSDYKILKQLGKGAQGTVYQAVRKDNGKMVAIKVLKVKYESKEYIQAINETEMLEEISKPQCNPFLSCYYEHSYDMEKQELLIEMEFIQGITLDDYSKDIYKTGNYDKLYLHLRLITKDIITGLQLVHQKGIIHNDIKPINILIDKDLTPKLIDFGVACKTKICNYDHHQVKCCPGFSGTPYYASPEMIDTNERYFASDVWSLGVTLYFCATGGNYPFIFEKGDKVINVLSKISSQEPLLLNTRDEMLNEIVNGCLKKNIADRLTTEQIHNILNTI